MCALRTLLEGFFDEDRTTSLWDELKVELFGVKGPYRRALQATLKKYGGTDGLVPKIALGVHTERTDAHVWSIRRNTTVPIKTVKGLEDELQEAISNYNTNAIVTVETNPLRLVLSKPKPERVDMLSCGKTFDSIEMNKGYVAPFLYFDGARDYIGVCSLKEERFSHWLCVGMTGSGKSEMVGALAVTACLFNSPDYLSLILIDPKGQDFYRKKWEEIPHLAHPVIFDLEKAALAIREVRAELTRRMSGESPNDRLLLVVVDELASLVDEDFKPSKGIINDLKAISRLGRAQGIHLVLASQRGVKEDLPPAVKNNCTAKLTGRVGSSQEAYYASGKDSSGAELLPGNGIFLLNAPMYDNRRVQGLYLGLRYNDAGLDKIINETKRFGSESYYKFELSESKQKAHQTVDLLGRYQSFINHCVNTLKDVDINKITMNKIHTLWRNYNIQNPDGKRMNSETLSIVHKEVIDNLIT